MVTSRSSLGVEAAGIYGPVSIQGEYKMSQIFTDEMTFNISAYYAFVSFFITGEHRTYKEGKFSKVVPRRSIERGGPGAFELAVRYSVMNTSEAPTTFMNMETSGLTKDLSIGYQVMPTSLPIVAQTPYPNIFRVHTFANQAFPYADTQ